MKATPRSKAASVDLGNLEDVQREQRGKRNMAGTAPGQAMQNSILRAELEQWNGASPVRHLDPKTVIRSKWANRHELSFHDDEFKLLKDDIENAGGNVQPIKVRPVIGKEGLFEVIFGHRRHQACLELGFPVLAMISDVADQQMFIEMDRENRQRKDLRPFEQGMMYAHALDEGLFTSAKKMAEAVGVDLGNLGRSLSLARLPKDVISAFESPLELQHRWSADLTNAIKDRAEDVIKVAKQIQKESPRPSAKEVFDRLVRKEATADATSTPHKVRLSGSAGQSGAITIDPASKSISVSLKNVDVARAQELEDLIKRFIA